ncbi:L-ribulose-5-phosphate 4-epimerase [Clostridium neuense]|uniref:L-ribulose-5-phosphate 4-epimerase n=1 Tax=Clostridium neuense TaxID=1728934 RepID=A0ABW8TMH7_9CLOT
MLEALKKEVFDANIELVNKGLVIYTWGNVSGIDRESGLFVIKPSGVDYDTMKPDDMVVVDLEGNVVEGHYKPSSDTPTHIVLYKEYPEIGGVVHTHSDWATTFAQAGIDIPAFGTTHADYFYGDIPCARELTEAEVHGEYEKETGNVIVETLKQRNIKPLDIPAILVKNHGPFAWGKSPANAVYNAVVLDKVAQLAYNTMTLKPNTERVNSYLLDKHYMRKHGPNAYYGQGSK